LVFTPIEVTTLELPRDRRLSILRRSVPLGGLTALLSGVAVCVATVPLVAKVSLTIRLEFAVTVIILSAISPVQDHLRRMFHQSGRSWIAARLSMIQMTIVALAIALALIAGVPLPLVPFGALTIGNLVSVLVGVKIAGWQPRIQLPAGSRRSDIIRGGGWLTFGAGFSYAAGLATIAIVTDRSSAAAAGQAEAARVLSQPVTVMAIGVLAVFGPEMMAAAQRGLAPRLQKMTMSFLAVVAGATVVWLFAVGVPWPWSPISHVFATAYELRGLTAWMIVQQSVAYASLSYRAVLIGNGLAHYAGKLDIIASTVGVVGVYFTAPYVGAFSLAWVILAVDVVLFGVRARLAGQAVRDAAEKHLREPLEATS
jgi:hypothetical protein